MHLDPATLISRRSLLKAGGTAAAVASGLSLVGRGVGAQSPASGTVRFNLGFTPLGRNASTYYGQQLGLFAERGVEVEISAAAGTGPGIQQLVAGNIDVLLGDMSALINTVGKEPDPLLRSYAVLYAKAPQTIFFYADGPIKEPKDLEGKTIATSAGANEFVLFPAFAAANGIDPDSVTWQVVDATAKVGMLLQDQVDATSTTIFGLPGLIAGAGDRGIGYFMYGDHGIETHGAVLMARVDWADANLALLEGFIQAQMAAYLRTFAEPDAAVAAMQAQVPELDTAVALAEIALLPSIMQGEAQLEHGLGWHEEAKVAATYDVVVNVLEQPVSVPYTELYTNDLLAAS